MEKTFKKICFIRHSESLFNKYINEEDNNDLKNIFFDASLSDNGIKNTLKQRKQIYQKINSLDISSKLLIASPLSRSIETSLLLLGQFDFINFDNCEDIDDENNLIFNFIKNNRFSWFKNFKNFIFDINTQINPLCSELLLHSCDLSLTKSLLKKKYNNVFNMDLLELIYDEEEEKNDEICNVSNNIITDTDRKEFISSIKNINIDEYKYNDDEKNEIKNSLEIFRFLDETNDDIVINDIPKSWIEFYNYGLFESDNNVYDRLNQFLSYLFLQTEELIIIVGHADIFHILTNIWFDNCELQIIDISEDHQIYVE